MVRRLTVLCGLAWLAIAGPAKAASEQALAWREWAPALFDEAKRENRFVLLDLEAVWCHWCHVMETTTYVDPQVVRLIREKYIPVRVDQDANPDLSSRYGEPSALAPAVRRMMRPRRAER